MTEQPMKASNATSTSKRLIALLLIVTSAGYICRVAVTAVAPGMMREFALSQTQMGTVFSAFLIGYTLFQVPSGWLADHVSCRRIFLTLCAGWALLTALTALAAWRGFGLALAIPQLLAVRILIGVVTAPAYPTSGRTIALTLPPAMRARAIGLVFASLGIGSAITPMLLAPAANRFGWRAALAIAALLAAAAGALWWRFAPQELHWGAFEEEQAATRLCRARSRSLSALRVSGFSRPATSWRATSDTSSFFGFTSIWCRFGTLKC